MPSSSIEQNMIQVLNNCIETSTLKTIKHQELKTLGYFNRDLFNGESWSIRTRNESVSATKRGYLGQLILDLQSSHNFHVERGGDLNDTFTRITNEGPSTKSPIAIKLEINLQISQFRGLQVILRNVRTHIESTIDFTAAGGESLKALQECEAMLKAGITGWIAQMQQSNYHTNSIFPKIFVDTKTRSAGTLFDEFVRDMIANKKQLEVGEFYDPTTKHTQSLLRFAAHSSGVFAPATLTGPSTGAASSIKKTNTVETQTEPVVSFTQPAFLPPPFNPASPTTAAIHRDFDTSQNVSGALEAAMSEMWNSGKAGAGSGGRKSPSQN